MKNVVYINSKFAEKLTQELSSYLAENQEILCILDLQDESFHLPDVSSNINIILCSEKNLNLEGLPRIKIKTDFTNLSYASKNQLKSSQIRFQGKAILLKELVSWNLNLLACFEGKTLLDLISKKELQIGDGMLENKFEFMDRRLITFRLVVKDLSKLLERGMNKNCYVFTNSVSYESQAEILSKLNVSSCADIIHPSVRERYENLYFIDSSIPTRELSHVLGRIYRNIHILSQYEESEGIVWVKSLNGKIESQLVNSVIVQRDSLDSINERLVILSGEPGSGKTSILKHWSREIKKKSPSKIVLCYTLNMVESFLKENLFNTFADALNFLTKNTKGFSDPFAKDFLQKNLVIQNKTIILLDGLDEISPNLIEKIRNLIDMLLESSQVEKVVLSSRLHVSLRYIHPVYKIQELSEEWQKALLRNHCKILLRDQELINDEKVSEFSEELFLLLNSHNKDILSLGIPLHSKILTEAFKEELLSFMKSKDNLLPKSLNILELYEKYYKSKMMIYLTEKQHINTSFAVKLVKERIFESKIIDTALLLFLEELNNIKVIFSEDDKKRFISELLEVAEYGIIVEIIGEVPVFIHRTFAEFLLAIWMYTNLEKKSELVKTCILKPTFKVVKLFLDLMLARKSKFLTSIIIDDRNQAVGYITDINDVDDGGRDCLQIAASYGRTEMIRHLCNFNTNFLLSKIESLREITHVPYITPGIESIPLNIIEVLLEFGANPTLLKWESFGETDLKKILRNTICLDYLKTFQIIVGIMKKIKSMDNFVISEQRLLQELEILDEASKNDSTVILETLLSDYKWKDEDMLTAMEYALKFNRQNSLNVFLKLAKYFEREADFKTLLGAAIETQNLCFVIQVVEFILNGKYKPRISFICLEVLSSYAAQKNEDIFIYLIEQGNAINADILKSFASWYRLKVLKFIWEHFDVASHYESLLPSLPLAIDNEWVSFNEITSDFIYRTDNCDGWTILHWACEYDNIDLVREIITIHNENSEGSTPPNGKRNEFINKSDKTVIQKTPLLVAIESGSAKIVQELLENGADINVPNYNVALLSYLHEATNPKIKESNRKVKLLIKHGALVNAQDFEDSNTLLHLAAAEGNSDVIKILLENKADVNASNIYNETPLVLFCRREDITDGKYYETISLLIKHGALVDVKSIKDENTALHLAALRGNFDSIKLLIEYSTNINVENKYSETPLLCFCSKADDKNARYTDTINFLISHGGLVNVRENRNGNTALHWVAERGNSDSVKTLLDQGACFHAQNNDGETPLMCFYKRKNIEQYNETIYWFMKHGVVDSEHGNTELHLAASVGCFNSIKNLLEEGLDVNSMNKYGVTPLMFLSNRENITFAEANDIINLLLEYNVEVNQKDNYANTALHWAACRGNTNLIKFLLQKVATVNAINKYDETPLICFCRRKNVDREENSHTIKLLVKHNADINIEDIYGNTATHISAGSGDSDAIKILLENGADINALNKNGETPLVVLCSRKNIIYEKDIETLNLLLERGAVVKEKENHNEDITINMAATFGNSHSLNILIKKGGDVNSTNKNGETPLICLCRRKIIVDDECNRSINLMLKHKAGLNEKDKFGNTALHWAVKRRNSVTIQILLNKGSNVNTVNKFGETPLIIFCSRNDITTVEHNDTIRWLLERGARVNAKENNYGDSALHVAACYGNSNLLKILLENGADVNSVNKNGKTPLIYFCSRRNVNQEESDGTINLLIKHKAGMNEKDKYGDTPLHCTARNGNCNTIKILLDKGANVKATNKHGETPLMVFCKREDILQEKGHEIICLLLEWGAKYSNIEETSLKNSNDDNVNRVDSFTNEKSVLNRKDNYGNTALHIAAVKGNSVSIKILIEEGANVNAKNKYGETPLILFSGRENISDKDCKKVIDFFVDHNSVVNMKENDDDTALHVAACKGNFESIKSLLEKGADANAVNKFGQTPFKLFCGRQHFNYDKCKEIIDLMIDQKVKLNGKHKYGNTAIHWAARRGNSDSIKVLLDKGADVNNVNKNDQTPLMLYCSRQDIIPEECNEIINLLIQHKSVLNMRDDIGNTALHLAAQSGSTASLKILLDMGAEVNGINNTGRTPLMLFCARENIKPEECTKMIELFVQYDAEVNIKDDDGYTALHHAVRVENPEMTKALLGIGADPEARNIYDQTPFILFCAKGYANPKYCNKIVDLLVQHDDLVNMPDDIGLTALHWASRRKNLHVIKTLLDKGTDVNVRNKHKQTPLMIFCAKEHVTRDESNKIINLFIRHKAGLEETDDDGNTALHCAVETGSSYSVKILLHNGANVHVRNKYSQTPLILFCATKNIKRYESNKIIDLLIEHKAGLNERDEIGNTALHASMYSGNIETVKYLLDKGADVNARNKNGQTPLIFLCGSKNVEEKCNKIINLLIEHKARLNEKDKNGNTALHASMYVGNTQRVKNLLDKGADVNARNKNGQTPLIFLCGRDHVKREECNGIIDLLIEHKAGLNERDKNGNTALHASICSGNFETVKYLVDKGADVNVRNKNGQTPLIFLCGSENVVEEECNKILNLLIEHKAGLNERDVNGNTALHSAVHKGNFNLVIILLDKGADVKAFNKNQETPLILFRAKGNVEQEEGKKIMGLLVEHRAG